MRSGSDLLLRPICTLAENRKRHRRLRRCQQDRKPPSRPRFTQLGGLQQQANRDPEVRVVWNHLLHESTYPLSRK